MTTLLLFIIAVVLIGFWPVVFVLIGGISFILVFSFLYALIDGCIDRMKELKS